MLPTFESYGGYSSDNYGVNALRFTDANGRAYFYSYRTLVAFRDSEGLVVRQNEWGPTTGKHLNKIDGGTAEAKRARLDTESFEREVMARSGEAVPA